MGDEKNGVQGELDDLLIVFGDTEEKVAKYRVGDLFSILPSSASCHRSGAGRIITCVLMPISEVHRRD
jgi:hypothetical protein